MDIYVYVNLMYCSYVRSYNSAHISVILAHKPSTNHCTESQRLSTPLCVRECFSVTRKRNCALFHSSSGSSKITFSCSTSATQLSWSSVLTPSSRSGTSMKQILYSVPYVFDLILFVWTPAFSKAVLPYQNHRRQKGGLGGKAPLILRALHRIQYFTTENFSCWLISPPSWIDYLPPPLTRVYKVTTYIQ